MPIHNVMVNKGYRFIQPPSDTVTLFVILVFQFNLESFTSFTNCSLSCNSHKATLIQCCGRQMKLTCISTFK
jgi:ACR3 family arsenite efflux pump ArsB